MRYGNATVSEKRAVQVGHAGHPARFTVIGHIQGNRHQPHILTGDMSAWRTLIFDMLPTSSYQYGLDQKQMDGARLEIENIDLNVFIVSICSIILIFSLYLQRQSICRVHRSWTSLAIDMLQTYPRSTAQRRCHSLWSQDAW
jgi:hypothetical protein